MSNPGADGETDASPHLNMSSWSLWESNTWISEQHMHPEMDPEHCPLQRAQSRTSQGWHGAAEMPACLCQAPNGCRWTMMTVGLCTVSASCACATVEGVPTACADGAQWLHASYLGVTATWDSMVAKHQRVSTWVSQLAWRHATKNGSAWATWFHSGWECAYKIQWCLSDIPHCMPGCCWCPCC